MLAGDAAHLTNPTNGFGLVSGILDSVVLAEALAAVVNGAADEAVLDQYAQDRRWAFSEVASPSSVETKRLVFHSTDPARREADLEVLRRKAEDPALAREHFMLGHRLRTPSVVPA
ncbi:FAD-dependent monooxygenase [Ammonicoccus fulvus]|uniref:FAD-dependent monooxygenase n=1 Tax=Ammonicoccus fulvus TaxID=3138240 RepID=A0ABZ3FX86_9ACTN